MSSTAQTSDTPQAEPNSDAGSRDERRWWQSRKWHVAIIVTTSVVAVILAVLAYSHLDETGKQSVLEKVAEAVWSFLLVGVLSYFIKVLVEGHQDRTAKAELLDDYRKKVIDRLASLTYRIREAGSIVTANPTPAVYEEQMRNVLRSQSELGQLLHELDTMQAASTPIFAQYPSEIDHSLKEMDQWLGKLLDEWRLRDPCKTLLDEVAKEDRYTPKGTSFDTCYVSRYRGASQLMRNELVKRHRSGR